MSEIVVSELTKVYRRGTVEVVALRGLDARFSEGKVTWVRGPPGAGKTTLLHIVGGLDRATTGVIDVDDVNLRDLSDRELVRYRRRKVGFVFPSFNLIPVLTAAENVELPMRLAGTPAKERDARVAELLRAVGLEEMAGRRPDDLRGGEQQRVAVAVALANDPPILLADEPTGELDSEDAAGVLDLLKTASKERGKTVLLACQDPRAAGVADATVEMADGRTVSPR